VFACYFNVCLENILKIVIIKLITVDKIYFEFKLHNRITFRIICETSFKFYDSTFLVRITENILFSSSF